MSDISEIILRNLTSNEEYLRKVIPFLKEEYFETSEQKTYFKTVEKYFLNYNTPPSKEALQIDFSNLKIGQDSFEILQELSEKFDKDKSTPIDRKWLVDQTETFCQDRALYIALSDAVAISGGENKQLSKTAIPDIMSKALAISFDTNIGHDYIVDSDKRFEHYQKKENKIPMFLKQFNVVTNGGIPKKTLNCVVAETGGCKSILLANMASNYVINGETVLYISLEMEEIGGVAKRIDANLMDININDVDKIPKDKWDKKIIDLKKRVKNSLVIKEYPTSSATVSHFRFLLKELKQKKNFIPTVVIIDYLNICASAKIKTRTNMYEYVKSISEEIRALAVEENIIIFSALQFNSEGIGNSDPTMKEVGESRGLNHTLDFLFALIHTEDLTASNQVLVKVLKSRYGDNDAKFVIGLDKNKMRFFDNVNHTQNSQSNIIQPRVAPMTQVHKNTNTNTNKEIIV